MKKNIKINPHLIIWAIIGILIIVSVVKIIIWNIGTKSDFDPNNITDDYNTEALDVTYKVDRSKIEGFVDDGVTTVLMVGNNPITDRTDENGIPALVAAATKAEVYSAGFADTCLVAMNSTYSADYAPDAFSLSY